MAVKSSFEDAFPGINPAEHPVTSPATFAYNCFAWVAGLTEEAIQATRLVSLALYVPAGGIERFHDAQAARALSSPGGGGQVQLQGSGRT
jgi:hypothetical protein